MPAAAPILTRLRRSLLGAWLAVAYALAVLAAGLVPHPAQSHPAPDGAVLCSGTVGAVPETPAPAGEAEHCAGCPLGPVTAAPPRPPQQPAIVRHAVPAVAKPVESRERRPADAHGLPPSRGPPVAVL